MMIQVIPQPHPLQPEPILRWYLAMMRLISFRGRLRTCAGSHPCVDMEKDAAARV